MEQCANTQALNSYLSKQENQEKNSELFADSIIDDIQEIKDIIFELERKAKDFNGLDLTEDLKVILKDEIAVYMVV